MWAEIPKLRTFVRSIRHLGIKPGCPSGCKCRAARLRADIKLVNTRRKGREIYVSVKKQRALGKNVSFNGQAGSMMQLRYPVLAGGLFRSRGSQKGGKDPFGEGP